MLWASAFGFKMEIDYEKNYIIYIGEFDIDM